MMSIDIPLTIGVRGDITLRLRNMVTGEVESEQVVKNMLHNDYADRFFTSTSRDGNLVSWGSNFDNADGNPLYSCSIGTGDAAVSRAQGIQTALGSMQNRTARNRSDEGVNPVWVESVFVFPAEAQYTGTVRELALRSGVTGNPTTARQLVIPISKTIVHQLEVTWRVTADFGTQSWSGVIAGGQRNAVTDINWTLTMNNAQMMTICQRSTSTFVHIGLASATCAFYHWWTATGVEPLPNVICGTSNAASVIASDGSYDIKGSTLLSGAVERYPGSYTVGDLERESELELLIDQAVGDIGEMVLCSGNPGVTSGSYGGLFRVTFDPPLDKAANYKLKLKFKIKLDLT